MKIRPVGAELFHVDRQTDGRTDMTKLTVAVRNFANGPKFETASCTMGTGSFSVVKSGQGVTLTPHPLLVPLVMNE